MSELLSMTISGSAERLAGQCKGCRRLGRAVVRGRTVHDDAAADMREAKAHQPWREAGLDPGVDTNEFVLPSGEKMPDQRLGNIEIEGDDRADHEAATKATQRCEAGRLRLSFKHRSEEHTSELQS